MRKEVLQATIAEIAKTACCAWEDYAKRNRGINKPVLSAYMATQDWVNAERHLNDGDLHLARTVLGCIATLERREQQAWNAHGALAALAAYEVEADPC
jgi:hypothetical protein